MKKDSVLRLAIVGIMFTLVNAVLVQQYRLNDVSNQLEISRMRADINTDFTDELLWLKVNDTYEVTQEQLIAQGRVEGIVSYLVGDDKEILDNLWHEGYMRGLAQIDYEYDMLSDSNYEKGYHAAMQDAFPHTEAEFVNNSPRDVKEDAIKAPQFDTTNEDSLKDNEEVINALNVKIEELSSDQ